MWADLDLVTISSAMRCIKLLNGVAEVSQRLGVSTHSLYGWMKKVSNPDKTNSSDEHAAEIRRLKSESMRVTEERDILKKATAYFARDAK